MTVADDLIPQDSALFGQEEDHAAEVLIERIFRKHAALMNPVVEKALLIRQITDSIDPFIQSHTSVVCPLCRNVCCIDRHGRYDCYDLIYIRGLGYTPSAPTPAVADTDPCRFLASEGCGLSRSLRPFRCNWHFCTDLISSIEQGPAKPYREFLRRFQDIQRLRTEMADEFARARRLSVTVDATSLQSNEPFTCAADTTRR